MATRSELKRQYLESPVSAGVFAVKNLRNGKVLLGSSANLHGPLNKHRFMLSSGSHTNAELQRDFKAAGGEGFSFEILARVALVSDSPYEQEAALQELEQSWLTKLEPLAPAGYNLHSRIRE